MGLLSTGGEPLSWGTPEQQKAKAYVLDHGIHQLLHIYHDNKDKKDCPFLWGEEIEHIVVNIGKRKSDPVKLSLTAAPLIEKLYSVRRNVDWRPEYGSYMVESVPLEPYNDSIKSLLSVEGNMQERYEDIREHCGPNRIGVTLVTFPLLGVGGFTEEKLELRGKVADSLFIPDECINQTHPRYSTLTQSIRLRRGRKVCIQVPIFIDKKTLERAVDQRYNIDFTPMNDSIDCGIVEEEEEDEEANSSGGQKAKSTKPQSKEKKTKLFDGDDDENEDGDGGQQQSKKGCCHDCVSGKCTHQQPQQQAHSPLIERDYQTLFTPTTDYYYAQYEHDATEDKNNKKKRYNIKQRYDACPCPVHSVNHPCVYMDCMAFGMGLSCLQVTMQLPDINVARHAFDQLLVLCPYFLAITSATPMQKGLLCDSDVRWLTIAGSVDDRKPSEVPKIMKSRYDSASMYISPFTKNLEDFNDNDVEIHSKFKDQLLQEGKMDERLAQHFAHLFIRDPLVIFDQLIEIDDQKRSDHFENIQSTNWQTVRFKPPPPGSDIGWRVEFRVMDVMPTPFENAAFSVFIVLLTRAILKFKVNLYLPISLVDWNIGRAHRRNPVDAERRYHCRKDIFNTEPTTKSSEYCEMSIDQIFNGTKGEGSSGSGSGGFIGLIPLVKKYLESEKIPSSEGRMQQYLELISKRASGELLTSASFLRRFVTEHPDYEQDSRVTPQIAKDLVVMSERLSKGELFVEDYLPKELVLEKKHHHHQDDADGKQGDKKKRDRGSNKKDL